MENNPTNLLNNILSNPDTIKNIKDIFNNLNKQENDIEQASEILSSRQNSELSFLENLLNENGDGEFLKKINNAYNVYANKSLPSINLLDALTPYLSPQKAMNLNKIKTAVRISSAVSELNKK